MVLKKDDKGKLDCCVRNEVLQTVKEEQNILQTTK